MRSLIRATAAASASFSPCRLPMILLAERTHKGTSAERRNKREGTLTLVGAQVPLVLANELWSCASQVAESTTRDLASQGAKAAAPAPNHVIAKSLIAARHTHAEGGRFAVDSPEPPPKPSCEGEGSAP
ncbi:hypothetical protein GQ53DRAFT_761199 [Thozetella sp. PMI_491]|nr:hypothetical protein GQ53DRAFT_761199 [Thozetella sp. PMI_491]